MAEQEQLVCFLVAPFGQKEQQLGGGTVGTFELIRSAVKEIVESFPDITIKLKGADEIVDVGSVAETFIAALFKADIVIADLSAVMNANVFYELGIRYALKRGITIPVWQKNTKLPADLHGILGVEYEGQNPLASREQFYQFLRQRLKSQQADSPVYRVLPSLEIMQAEEVAHLRSEIQSLRTQVSQVLLNESVQVLLNEAEVLANKEDTKTAIEKLKLAYSAVPQNLTVTLRFGQLLSKVKRHDEAISILHNAVRIAAQSGGPSSIPCRELGMAYKRSGNAQLAADWLQKAVDEDPSDSDAHGIIGGVYKDALEIDKAIDAYQRGFDADQASTYCLLNVLCLLFVRNQSGDRIRIKRLLPKCEKLTQQVLQKRGYDHWEMFDRAHYLLYDGKLQEALKWFEDAANATKTVGEIDSARKNLDLLKECGVPMKGLDQAYEIVEARTEQLRRSQECESAPK